MLEFKKKLILGSQSPRRKELMQRMDIDFEVRIADVEEIIPEDLPLHEAPEYLAKLKADAIALADDELLITADSVVILDGEILGKPRNNEEAASFLARISGRNHDVITGVCISDKHRSISFSDKTVVSIAKINEHEIEYYVEKYNALDKAGAYGIQDWIGWVKVERIKGSYANVMGLPTHKMYEELMKWVG